MGKPSVLVIKLADDPLAYHRRLWWTQALNFQHAHKTSNTKLQITTRCFTATQDRVPGIKPCSGQCKSEFYGISIFFTANILCLNLF